MPSAMSLGGDNRIARRCGSLLVPYAVAPNAQIADDFVAPRKAAEVGPPRLPKSRRHPADTSNRIIGVDFLNRTFAIDALFESMLLGALQNHFSTASVASMGKPIANTKSPI
jgi:hypothetical protein